LIDTRCVVAETEALVTRQQHQAGARCKWRRFSC
jgi:hypothetical protein